MSDDEGFDTEIELIESSLLPAESLAITSAGWPREINIHSDSSSLSLHVNVQTGYPHQSAVEITIKGGDVGREEAEAWKDWTRARMTEWDEFGGYPLYQILTAHFLPLLAPSPP
ncbi:hypothetical protein P7C73_g5433, partial [Tremellales sp. Uapishka_1]